MSPHQESIDRQKLGLPWLAITGLALLGAPRVVLHDLDLIHEGTFVNSLFVIIPPLLWIAAAVLLRIRRPFLTLLTVGAVYGGVLALIHQLLWHQAFPAGPPSLGGNLADLDPVLQEVIMRGFAVVPSIVTGLLVGAVCGLIAAGLAALIARFRGASSVSS